MATELKPCPFCGREAMLIECTWHVYIKCKSHCCEQSLVYKDKDDAIEAWNRRAEDGN